MSLKTSIIAASLFCLVLLAPALSMGAQEREDPFEHHDAQVPFSPDFKADFQSGIEEMFILTAADEPQGEGVRKKILSNFKALLGQQEDDAEDTGTQPDVDLTKRRPYFSKQGWKGYMEFVKEGQVFLKETAGKYEMGNGIIILTGTMDDKKQRYWLGPEEKDRIVYSSKGHFICRAMESVMCDSKFRIHVAFTPQDPDTFADVVITAWQVEFLNDKDRPVNHN